MTDAAVHAIQFALRHDIDEGEVWLRLWNEGSFEVCRREWPEAPIECYIGADPLLSETKALLRQEAETRRRSACDAELAKVALRFVDRAGDHCKEDPAEKICDEFSAAASDVIDKYGAMRGMPSSKYDKEGNLK